MWSYTVPFPPRSLSLQPPGREIVDPINYTTNAMFICAGCSVEFPSSLSHSSHLQQAEILAFHTLFLRALAYLPQLSDSGSEMDGYTFFGILQPSFRGDFFGEKYDKEDFDMDDEHFLGVIPPDSEDGDDFDQGQGWGPPPLDLSRSSPPDGEVIDDEDVDAPPTEARRTAEGRFLVKPTAVTCQDAFPQSTAGMWVIYLAFRNSYRSLL